MRVNTGDTAVRVDMPTFVVPNGAKWVSEREDKAGSGIRCWFEEAKEGEERVFLAGMWGMVLEGDLVGEWNGEENGAASRIEYDAHNSMQIRLRTRGLCRLVLILI